MKLKSITVGNFKNIAETTLNLNKMIAVVSTNNYGKSNLLEAIRFGFAFIEGSAKSRTRLMQATRCIPLSPVLAGKDYIFSVEFEDPKLDKYRFVRYSFRFSWFNDQDNGAVITDETIEMRESESVRYSSYLKRNDGLYRAEKSKTNFRKISLAKNVLAIDILSSLDDIEISAVIAKIKSLSDKIYDSLESSSYFLSDPFELDIGAPSMASFSDNNIPKSLCFLKEKNPEKYDLFVETLNDLFPEFEQIEVMSHKWEVAPQVQAFRLSNGSSNTDENDNIDDVPFHLTDTEYRLIIHSEHLNQPISVNYMSAGTKRIIWLIANAIFSSCNEINLIGIDEIETSIHPKMIRSLLESLNDILDDTSMIVTSHSPYLIQYLKPESIYVGVPNDNGVAVFKKIQHTKTKTLVKTSRELKTSVGEYLFDLMSGDEDSAYILSAYLEE